MVGKIPFGCTERVYPLLPMVEEIITTTTPITIATLAKWI